MPGPRAAARADAHRSGGLPGRSVAMLRFEAARCPMALPAEEVLRLAPEPPGGEVIAAVDLDARFGGTGASGPWLQWRRGASTRWLRVDRVVEVFSCEVRSLRPMPAWLRARGQAGPFWAVGVREQEVFLLVDPARL